MSSRIVICVVLCAGALAHALTTKVVGQCTVENLTSLADNINNLNKSHWNFLSSYGYIGYGEENVSQGWSAEKSNSKDVLDHENMLLDISDEDYYAMPPLFGMYGDYMHCMKLNGLYCVGKFQLAPLGDDRLYRIMKEFSANWVDSFNHTELYRALCVTRACPAPDGALADSPEAWFESCVNASMTAYNLTARLSQLDSCSKGKAPAKPLTTSDKAFIAVMVFLLAVTSLSTFLDLRLSDEVKKDYGWALSWSLKESWNTLTAPSPPVKDADLRCFDGLRVFSMLFVVGVHMLFFTMKGYVGEISFELDCRKPLTMFLKNTTLVVQIFFFMSSFLMARKLLQDKEQDAPIRTFFSTLLSRIVRLTPSYFVVVWFSMTWLERVDDGPMWSSIVGSEANRCRRNWWRQLFYLDNDIEMHDRCMLQSWYLSVDMQFYAMSLALTLLLRRYSSSLVLLVLSALFLLVVVANLVLAYAWHLVPNFALHAYQPLMNFYEDNLTMRAVYTSPLGNAVSPLAGLLVAHAQHASRRPGFVRTLLHNKIFRLVSSAVALPALAACMALTAGTLPKGPLPRLAAALVTGLERPIFILLVAVALFGAINGVDSVWKRLLQSGRVMARLTYGAFLVHNLLVMAVSATRFSPAHLDFKTGFMEAFGILTMSFIYAMPLTLLVELPSQKLYNEIKSILKRPKTLKTT